uniref:hypothetical protein n=1 Tax=Herbidospora sakaeratensis TaxID=564415 RepID=UPI000AA61A84|nr:hypothetical protein [Herbidospora sakaeratensis]
MYGSAAGPPLAGMDINPLALLPTDLTAAMHPGERLAYLAALDEDPPPAPSWAAGLLALRFS